MKNTYEAILFWVYIITAKGFWEIMRFRYVFFRIVNNGIPDEEHGQAWRENLKKK